RSLVAGNDLEPGADEVVEHGPVEPRRGAWGRDDELMGEGVIDRLYLRQVPSIEHRAVAENPSDPVEARRIGNEPGRAEDLVEVGRLVEHADGGAVLRRAGIEVVGGADAGRPRHVLRDDRGLTGEMPAEITSNQPAVGVVTAAARRRDDEIDALALVEII